MGASPEEMYPAWSSFAKSATKFTKRREPERVIRGHLPPLTSYTHCPNNKMQEKKTPAWSMGSNFNWKIPNKIAPNSYQKIRAWECDTQSPSISSHLTHIAQATKPESRVLSRRHATSKHRPIPQQSCTQNLPKDESPKGECHYSTPYTYCPNNTTQPESRVLTKRHGASKNKTKSSTNFHPKFTKTKKDPHTTIPPLLLSHTLLIPQNRRVLTRRRRDEAGFFFNCRILSTTLHQEILTS